MSNKVDCVFWLAIDTMGNFIIADDRRDLAEEMAKHLNGRVRTVKLEARITPPADESFSLDIPYSVAAATELVANVHDD